MRRLNGVHPLSVREEGPYIPIDAAGRRRMERLLEVLEVPRVTSGGMRDWLEDKAAGRPDRTSSVTRAKYRKLIAAAAPNGYDPGAELVDVVRIERALVGAGVARARAREAAKALAQRVDRSEEGAVALQVLPLAAPIMYRPPYGELAA